MITAYVNYPGTAVKFGGEESVLDFGDGTEANKGEEVSSGVYFYEALVIFDTHDPSLEKQQIKGWAQLIR